MENIEKINKNFEEIQNNITSMAQSILLLQETNKVLLDEVNSLKQKNNILIEHIAFLEKRTKKFSDKFKFGRFKPKNILNEIQKEPKPIAKFTLNDD